MPCRQRMSATFTATCLHGDLCPAPVQLDLLVQLGRLGRALQGIRDRDTLGRQVQLDQALPVTPGRGTCTGDTGPTGPGFTGYTGPGFTGPIGPTVLPVLVTQGTRVTAGYTGYTGPGGVGFTGSLGPTGPTGPGFTGPTGWTGHTGYTGYAQTGYSGPTGYTGPYPHWDRLDPLVQQVLIPLEPRATQDQSSVGPTGPTGPLPPDTQATPDSELLGQQVQLGRLVWVPRGTPGLWVRLVRQAVGLVSRLSASSLLACWITLRPFSFMPSLRCHLFRRT